MSEKGTVASGAGKRFSISNLLPSAFQEYACQSEQPCTSFPLLLKKPTKQKKTTKKNLDTEMKTEIQARS